MKNAGKMAGLAAVAIIVVAVIVLAYSWNEKDREAQLKDFAADLKVMGFVNPQITWDDETTRKNGSTKTESVLEALVSVNGCQLELERERDEGDTIVMGVNEVELYVLDEGIGEDGKDFDFEDEIVRPKLEKLEEVTRHDDRLTHCAS